MIPFLSLLILSVLSPAAHAQDYPWDVPIAAPAVGCWSLTDSLIETDVRLAVEATVCEDAPAGWVWLDLGDSFWLRVQQATLDDLNDGYQNPTFDVLGADTSCVPVVAFSVCTCLGDSVLGGDASAPILPSSDGADDDADGDGWSAGTDCDDANAEVHPAPVAEEDATMDAVAAAAELLAAVLAFCDADGDGFFQAACSPLTEVDCADGDATVHPGAEDAPYDGVDSDCDGAPESTMVTSVGEGVVGSDATAAEDSLVDAILDALDEAFEASEVDDDGDGVFADEGDCDDGDASVYPGATEDPDNGVDDNCDGRVGVDDLRTGDLFVTELMADPTGDLLDTNGEWFELYNATEWVVDLEGLRAIESDGSTGFRVNRTVEVASGSLVVFARRSDPAVNGGLSVAYAYSTAFWLNNRAADSFRLTTSTTTLDEVRWGDGTGLLPEAGHSLVLSESAYNAADNDSAAAWAVDATHRYQGDANQGNYGTPGW